MPTPKLSPLHRCSLSVYHHEIERVYIIVSHTSIDVLAVGGQYCCTPLSWFPPKPCRVAATFSYISYNLPVHFHFPLHLIELIFFVFRFNYSKYFSMFFQAHSPQLRLPLDGANSPSVPRDKSHPGVGDAPRVSVLQMLFVLEGIPPFRGLWSAWNLLHNWIGTRAIRFSIDRILDWISPSSVASLVGLADPL